jgi:hypothetical protein
MTMEKAAFVVQQDFEALRLNASNHALFSPFGLFQGAGTQFGPTYEDRSPGPSYQIVVGPALEETLTKNQLPAAVFKARQGFKQRTFPGKPLSDEQILHASRIASQLDDDLTLRRRPGR